MWIRPLLQMRTRQGAFHNLIKEMRLSDPEKHFSYFKMTKETFDVLLQKVEQQMFSSKRIKLYMFIQVSPKLIHRRYSNSLRAEVSPAERLALTLRFLASGDSQVILIHHNSYMLSV